MSGTPTYWLSTIILCLGLVGPFTPGAATENSELRQADVRLGVQSSVESEIYYFILLAELAGKRGEFDVALENYRAASKASDDPRIAERATSIALFLDRNDIALEMAQRWHGLDSTSIQATQSLALALLRDQQVTAAVPLLEEVRTALQETQDDGQDGYASIAALFEQLSDRQLAFETMTALREKNPDSAYAAYFHALIAMQVDAAEQALEGLNHALEQKPDWERAELSRAEVLLALDEEQQAIDSLAEAVATQPDSRPLRIGYARVLITTDNIDQAREQFEILAEQNPDDGDSLYALGLLAAESDQLDQAEEYFLEVINLGTRLMDVYYEMGKVEEVREHFEKARDWYAQVIEGDRYLSAQVRAATMEAKLGKFDVMGRQFTQLREQNPDNAIALFIAESEVLREESRYQAAFSLLDAALETHPDDHDLLYSRALIAERLDRLDILEKDLSQILAEDPDNGHALNALGYTLADRTDRYEEALAYIEKALALLPEDAAVLDSMGWVKYRLDDHEAALKYLRQAYDLNPDPEIASHLSEVLWKAGQQEEARAIFQEAMSIHPDDSKLLEVQERLGL